MTLFEQKPEEEMLEACERGVKHRVLHLLDYGVPVDMTDRDGITPLRMAARGGQNAIVKLLLAHGAKVTVQDFIAACYSGNVYAVQNLQSAMRFDGLEFDLFVEDRPLVCTKAFLRVAQPRVVQLLLEMGASANDRDPHGRSALDLAKAFASPEVVLVLQQDKGLP